MLGRYRLERLLGEGGMGVVYVARHEDLGKPAAVKILNERHGQSEEIRARFLREGQAAARIRHPNIVDVYDVGVDGGRAYLVMELLEGEDLRRLIGREGPLDAQRTADLMVPVVAALAAAHDAGVVHRDLKPDNVFVARERNTLAPKVLDFGISKLADPEQPGLLTGTGALLGTPYYMSPEQAKSARNIDAQSDQYSCGVILYECVTGRRPLEEPSIYQLIQRIVHGDFAPPRQLNPSIPAALEQLILKAMAAEPQQRFPTTRAFGRALLEFASDRVRGNYADEFAEEAAPAVPAAAPAANRPLALGTTLRESVHERDTARPVSRRRTLSLPVFGTLILGAGLVAALGFRLSQRSNAEPPAAPAPVVSSAPAAAAPSAVGAPPAVPAVSRKQLLSEPAGAAVHLDGKLVGRTPMSLEVPAAAAIEVELVLPGFETARRTIVTADPPEIAVKLSAKPARAKPGVKPAAASRPELAPR
jgi:serine/threonine-protein kinase